MMKKFLLSLMFIFFINPVFAIGLNELNLPLAPSSRLGVGDKVENHITVKAREEKQISELQKTKSEVQNISAYSATYADLALKRIAIDVADELDEEQSEILNDLSTLWTYSAQNSQTLQYMIYKLSNPDEDKPDDNMLKKILRPVASFSSIAGTAFSANPFMASGAMIGGNILSALTSDNKEINYKFSKVNDADMVILVRKIDDLQKRLLNLYIDYKTRQKIYEMAVDNLKKREQIFNSMQNKPREQVILADVYYRNAQNFANKTKSEYYASRTILEQLAGKKAVEEIENKDKEI